jgi:hypothetical protein
MLLHRLLPQNQGNIGMWSASGTSKLWRGLTNFLGFSKPALSISSPYLYGPSFSV